MRVDLVITAIVLALVGGSYAVGFLAAMYVLTKKPRVREIRDESLMDSGSRTPNELPSGRMKLP
jgi:hypothetical protein